MSAMNEWPQTWTPSCVRKLLRKIERISNNAPDLMQEIQLDQHCRGNQQIVFVDRVERCTAQPLRLVLT